MVNINQKQNLIIIENGLGLKAVFSMLGAAIYQIFDKNVCLTRNVASLEDFEKPICYYGKTIGRSANRIKGNILEIEGKKYKLFANENGNVLHGGLEGLSNQVFDYATKEDENSIVVNFSYLSKHLESGYPGNLSVKITYKISKNENQLRVDYECTTDQTTLCSLTNHTYFTLGSNHIKDLSLKLDSDTYLDVDKELIATGKKPVDNFFDFREGKPLPEKGGIDHFFYLKNKEIVLLNDKYKLSITSNFEGVQIYTSNWKHPDELCPKCDNILDSVAIEPSDSHLDLHFLKKGETYTRYIIYNIERLKDE